MNRKTLMAALCIFAGACAQQTSAPAAPNSEIIIRNVTIVSPERTAPGEAMDVLIRDGRIAEVGRDLAAHEHSMEIDGAGKYLTPGLIDGHTHLGWIAGMSPAQEQANPELADRARAQIPRSYLYYGFTTVVDLSGEPDSIAAWNAAPMSPQAYFCGGAPIMDGYPMLFAPKPLRYSIMPYFLMENGVAPDGVDAADHTPGAVVERIKRDGGICVKTHYEDGFGDTNDWPVPSADLIRELVAKAHEHNMPVLLHANAEESQEIGLDAGVDAFAHGMWTWRAADIDLNDEIVALLDRIIAAKIATQPTVQVLFGERDLHDPEYLAGEDLKHAVPQELIDWYGSEDGQTDRMQAAGSPYLADFLQAEGWQAIDAEPIARVKAATAYLAAHGGRLLFGSDTPSAPTFANPPGLNGREEMRHWAEAGIAPMQFLRAATLVNAAFFNLEDEIGSVEAGKRADLLLLLEDPSQSITAFDSIELVIVAGEVAARDTLSAKR